MRTRTLRSVGLATGTVLVLTATVVWRIWFSDLVVIDDREARITAHRSWGCIRTISIDEDQDGRPEAVSRYPGCLREFPGHAQPARTEVDESGSGRFNLEFRYAPGEGVTSVRHDTNGDGTYDVVLEGAAAHEYEKAWRQRHLAGIRARGGSSQ